MVPLNLLKIMANNNVLKILPEIAGFRMASLITMAVASMVSRKSEIFTALLVSSSSFIHCALLSVAGGLPRLYLLETSSSSACWFGIRLTFAWREIRV